MPLQYRPLIACGFQPALEIFLQAQPAQTSVGGGTGKIRVETRERVELLQADRLPASSFATHPIAVTIQVPSIAGVADADRCGAGSPRLRAVGEFAPARLGVGPRGARL